jgi:Second Messenger Oligonucleotide or Dinucleotide Synthetase domain
MLAEAFKIFKSNLELNDSFNTIVQARHNSARSIIENNYPGAETKLIGSLARQTRIQPRSGDDFDIDILVNVGEFHSWAAPGQGLSADSAMSNFLSSVQKSEKFAHRNPAPLKPAVAIKYADKTRVELVPAYVDKIGQFPNGSRYAPVGRAYWVPKSTGWELADYDYDAAYVTAANKSGNGWLIPAIKMLKAVKRNNFPQMPSFYYEMLAVRILAIVIKNRIGSTIGLSYPALITAFFNIAGDWLNLGLSLDGSLTPAVSLTPDLMALKSLFDSIGRYTVAIEGLDSDTKQQREWREVCGDPFPSV